LAAHAASLLRISLLHPHEARVLPENASRCTLGCRGHVLPPPAVIAGNPTSFDYSSIAAKHIAFGRPVVVSSEIFYENRFTNQSYHSIDKSITQDAFFRDFKQAVLASGLDGRSCRLAQTA